MKAILVGLDGEDEVSEDFLLRDGEGGLKLGPDGLAELGLVQALPGVDLEVLLDPTERGRREDVQRRDRRRPPRLLLLLAQSPLLRLNTTTHSFHWFFLKTIQKLPK